MTMETRGMGKRNVMRGALRMMLVAVIALLSSNVAWGAKPDLTDPAVIEEGLSKAEAALANMAKGIDELQEQDDLMQLQAVLNPIELRKVKKTYGKIELTDEMRPRLVAANMLVAKALQDMLDRMSAPMEVREAMATQVTEEKITEEIAKAKTLREVLE